MRVLVRRFMCALSVKKRTCTVRPFSDKIRKEVFERLLQSVFRVCGVCHFCLTHFKFSSCATIPRGCNRCDDECAKKDGKQGKDDYKKQRQRTRTNTIQGGRTKTSGPQEHGEGKVLTMCSYNCEGWPNEKCRVSFHFQNPEIWRKKKLWFWFQTPRCSDHRQRRQLGKLPCPFQAGHQGWQLSKVSKVFFMGCRGSQLILVTTAFIGGSVLLESENAKL